MDSGVVEKAVVFSALLFGCPAFLQTKILSELAQTLLIANSS